MNKLLGILAMAFGFAMVAVDTEAARVGGGRSSGRQSSSATNSAAPAQKTAPAQQAAPKAAPTPAPSGMSKWLGPLAGLAAGIGIASLLSSMGMGGALGSMVGGILMIVLLLGAGYFIYRMLTRNKSAPQQPLGYAGAGNTTATPEPASTQAQPAQFTGNAGGAAPGSLAATLGGASTLNAAPNLAASRWPADFDAPEFERQAKMNFERLQAANDAGDASTLRDFLTPELYRELEGEMKSAWGAQQKTESVDLHSEVLEVVTEGNLYVVSVRFTGQIRENGVLSNLNEIWHLEKPVSGGSGWRVSGIQQAS
jgi:predicted lipid-binding transport protein (Tim44 family)